MDPMQQIERLQREFAEQVIALRSVAIESVASRADSDVGSLHGNSTPRVEQLRDITAASGASLLRISQAMAGARLPHGEDLINLHDWHTIHLLLSDHQITMADISPLGLGLDDGGRVKSLTELGFTVTNPARFADLPELKTLYLRESYSGDLAPLSRITKLRTLWLPDNNITSLEGLGDCIHLRELDIGRNEVTDLTPLKTLQQLETLEAYDNRVSDPAPLRDLSSLTSLNLNGNLLSSLGEISKLLSLTVLALKNNRLSSIEQVGELRQLTWLDVAENSLTALPPLRELQHLKTLVVSGNEITDLTPVRDLPSLKSLHVSGNPLSTASLRLLEELKRGGVTVSR